MLQYEFLVWLSRDQVGRRHCENVVVVLRKDLEIVGVLRLKVCDEWVFH